MYILKRVTNSDIYRPRPEMQNERIQDDRFGWQTPYPILGRQQLASSMEDVGPVLPDRLIFQAFQMQWQSFRGLDYDCTYWHNGYYCRKPSELWECLQFTAFFSPQFLLSNPFLFVCLFVLVLQSLELKSPPKLEFEFYI